MTTNTNASKMQKSLVNISEEILENNNNSNISYDEEDEWTVENSENDENLLQFKKISISRSQSTPFPLIVQLYIDMHERVLKSM